MSDPYLAQIEKEKKLSQEIVSLREEVKNLKAEVKYERELRVKGTEYHPTDYHSRFKLMMDVVKKEKKLTDLFDMVDEAQKRLRNEG